MSLIYINRIGKGLRAPALAGAWAPCLRSASGLAANEKVDLPIQFPLLA